MAIKKILMERDSITEQEADQLIANAKQDLNTRLANGEIPDNICSEWFGLEPDYIMELIWGVNDMFTIKDKAQAISNNNKLTFGVRVKYSAIAKGIIKPTEYDRKYIVGTYTSLESATHK